MHAVTSVTTLKEWKQCVIFKLVKGKEVKNYKNIPSEGIPWCSGGQNSALFFFFQDSGLQLQRAQGLIPGQGTKIPKAAWHGQKKKKYPGNQKKIKKNKYKKDNIQN